MRKLHYFIFILGFSLLASCSHNLQEISLETFEGKVWSSAVLQEKKAKVYFFFAPECPISINYTKAVNAFYADSSNSALEMAVIIPGSYYTDSALAAFVQTYQLEIPVVLDRKKQLTNLLEATVTPEVFLLDGKDNSILYSGKIDNWAMGLGSKRRTVTEFYLNDALQLFRNGEEIIVNRTTPVGCFIE
jgi:hypothetical protein